jgi:hypothetical protein
MTKEVKQEKSRRAVYGLIRECQGSAATEPELPVFFMDSPNWRTDQNTADELTALQAFVCQKDALPTHDVVAPDVRYLRIEPEEQKNILVDTQILGPTDGDQERIQTYEDRVREKRTAYDGVEITYSEWTATRRWTVRAKSTVRREERKNILVETQILGPEDGDRERIQTYEDRVRETRTAFDGGITYIDWTATNRWEVRAKSTVRREKDTELVGESREDITEYRWFAFVKWTVVVGCEVTERYRQKERIVITDFDRNVSYGNWRVLRGWEQVTRRYFDKSVGFDPFGGSVRIDEPVLLPLLDVDEGRWVVNIPT